MNNIPEIPLDWTPCMERANEPFTLSIFIVYNNMSAALRAALVVERLGERFHGKMEPRLQPLPLAHLQDPASFDRSLSDAANADMIIVSISGQAGLSAELKSWIANCTAQKRGSDSAVVALLGTLDDADAPDSPRLEFLKRSTQGAGLDFFAPQVVEDDNYLLNAVEVVS